MTALIIAAVVASIALSAFGTMAFAAFHNTMMELMGGGGKAMTGNVKTFPGIVDSAKAADVQPDEAVVRFCEDLVQRAKSGEIRAIAVALVKHGRVTADGWRRGEFGADCAHELMAAITYLQLRYGNQINATADREAGQ